MQGGAIVVVLLEEEAMAVLLGDQLVLEGPNAAKQMQHLVIGKATLLAVTERPWPLACRSHRL